MEEKIKALNNLGPLIVSVTHSLQPSYIARTKGVERKEGNFLAGVYGYGKTKVDAINDYWYHLTEEITCDQRVVIDAYTPQRRELMWDQVTRSWADYHAPQTIEVKSLADIEGHDGDT